MIKKTLKTLKRAPVRAFAVLLFAAVISMIICALQASNEAELRNYEEALKSVPVTVTVKPIQETNGPQLIMPWVYDLFATKKLVKFYDVTSAKDSKEAYQIKPSEPSAKFSLSEYVTDIQVKMQQSIEMVNGIESKDLKTPLLYGITSISSDEQLLPEHGCEITWYEGYDESIFAGDEAVCLIPDYMARYYDNGNGETVLKFLSDVGYTIVNGEIEEMERTEYQRTLKIAGTYTAGDEKSIYCPLSIIEDVYIKLVKRAPIIWSLSATLADNSRLEEFREKASYCFLEPSPNSEELRWGFYVETVYNEFYEYALDINDENLFDLSAVLEDSIKFNRTVTVFVVILSVISGFLIGFLMVRRRKRDIMLMRIVGESNARVFFGFALEQLICIVLGIAVGGAYYNWNPINNLAIFAVAYFIALSLALTIFMSKKLIKNIKEDE